MSWRGVKGGIEASQKKLPVVMSPAPIYYLDMGQGEPTVETPIYDYARLNAVYKFDILAPGIDSTYVLGGQANLWTEQIPTPAQAEYMITLGPLRYRKPYGQIQQRKTGKTLLATGGESFQPV
jgi:hexosaminidase